MCSMSDKEIKKEFKAKASKSPDKYYATTVLKDEGFSRRRCSCGTYFWTTTERATCDDPVCSGGFRFFDKPPASQDLDYIGVWKRFSEMFQTFGYTPIKRYPVVARWREDTDFVQASIYNFQPYVVSGEVNPPANPLVVPQFSLRFNDVDNVGITGAHYTGFVMIGQHAFMPANKFDQHKYFTDIYTWLRKGLGLPKDEITFHEDAWAGGGNFGPCMEYFSRGLELGNQVYMLYEVTPSGPKELKLKVLDMGMGHERNAWFVKAASTSYETTFPTVCKKMHHATGIKVHESLIKRFLPYASYLNVDEVENIDKAWELVGQKTQTHVQELRDCVLPLAALYSVAEHCRSLLVALSDGALPSNVGGGYNLRMILRRALSFIDQYQWNIDLPQICEWHAEYLKPLFPELSEHLDEVATILDVEKTKYENTKQKTKAMVAKVIREDITEDKLIGWYDSQGIAPELIREAARELGKEVKIPENFYAAVAERHEKTVQEHATHREEKLDLQNVPETHALYFKDYSIHSFKARIEKVIGQYVILENTYFYPTSGGQLHDLGTIQGERVVDVFKQGNVIVHVLSEPHTFIHGEEVVCEIDWLRRKQLAIHHTATHIVNAACRRVLGNHINQASAKKDVDKAHLDITHYQALTEEDLEKIEAEANRVVKENIALHCRFISRDEAEKKFGMNIYQGGVVPGKQLRIVEIPEVDVEACGGTHLHTTKEVGEIKIVKSTKVQDGIVRIVFTAGDAAKNIESHEQEILKEAAAVLNCTPSQIPARAEELFNLWKMVVKKGKSMPLQLTATQEYQGDVVAKAAEILKTQPEHMVKTLQRFWEEIKEKK